MQYALIHNDTIEVGPRNWNYYYFLEYLEDENLSIEDLPRRPPIESIISDDWKIFLVTEVTYPENLNRTFEELVGPFWTIHEDHITGLYNRKDRAIPAIKGDLKNTVAANRYVVETGKLEYTFGDGETVELYTEREQRMIYLNTLSVLPDGETVPFKFKGGKFRSAVTKAELSQIVTLSMNHVRSAFEWEAEKVAEIEALDTIEDLKEVKLQHPTQITNDEEVAYADQ
jgi:hypothetical protein